MKTVGIIGAGATGLCAIRRCLESGFHPVCWEQNEVIGGDWVYSDKVGRDENGLLITTSAYKNLRANLPREVAGFIDFPMTEGDVSYNKREDVLQYIHRFAAKFNLLRYIKFNYNVEEVEPLIFPGKELPSWKVKMTNLKDKGEVIQSEVDFIIVANGHNTYPRIPIIEGIDKFSGTVIHSKDYRLPSPYKNKSVAMLGMGPSGLDISVDISQAAKKIYLCHNKKMKQFKLPPNVIEKPGIKCFQGEGFELNDGTFIKVDGLIYCTGYEFTFPFLKETCGIKVENDIVKPLYRRVIHAVYQSMAFPGLPLYLPSFPAFDAQVRFAMEVFKNNVKVPNGEDYKIYMQNELDDLTNVHKQPHRKLYYFTKAHFRQYIEQLEKEADLEQLPEYYYLIADYNRDVMQYRYHEAHNLQYNIIDQNTVSVYDINDPNTSEKLHYAEK